MVLSCSGCRGHKIIYIYNKSTLQFVARILVNLYLDFHQMTCTVARDVLENFYQLTDRIERDSTVHRSCVAASNVLHELDLVGVNRDFDVHWHVAD